MQLDTASFGQRFILDEHEEKQARTVSPYTLAWLQNKVSDAAVEVLTYEYKPNLTEKAVIIEHEKLKARYAALTDLLNELTTEE